MKKILLAVFVYMAFTLPSFAVVTPEEVKSEDYIINHGHSNEMARLMDLQDSQVNGIQSDYKSKNPAWYAEKKVSFVRKVFMYFDPALDDEKFMQHNINYTNRWDDL